MSRAYSDRTMEIISMSASATGVTIDDLPVDFPRNILWKSCAAGRIFTLIGGSKAFKRHYFDTRERADAYYLANPLPKFERPARKPKTVPNVAAIPPRTVNGGPARLPGEPHFPLNADGSPAYKRTIAPSPPAVLYHSNTFSRSS